ncbi:MAG: UPF0158 family protein [Thermodesulfovibrionales bacterium]|nr:UPF0158 family protein [Thermodesulfovibrionales bacterium]
MKLLKIDFNEIRKTMEDVSRDAFDYFLDLETGSVATISVDALEGAKSSLYKGDELIDESLLEKFNMPEWIEDEVELAIRIFSEKERYVRIPERESKEAYSLMKKFTEGIDELRPHDKLSDALNSPDAFSRFKKTLSTFPEHKKKWFALNAKAMEKTITDWLASIGVKPEQEYYI